MNVRSIRRCAAAVVACVMFATAPQLPSKAEEFSQKEVELTDGMFKDSMETGAQFLLTYDVDRLAVSLFRYSANKDKAPVDMNQGYGGWENSGENGLGGHIYGHYMSACADMYAQTGDERFKKIVDRGVELLAIAQDTDGFVAGFSRKNLDYVFDNPDNFWAGGNNDAFLQGIWAPWYTIHKILAGLLDAYEYTGNEAALTCAKKLASYAKTGTDKLNDQQMEKMLIGEHGGINESFAVLYEITGEEQYIALAKRFSHKAVMDPLSRGENNLPGLHANTQIPKICGAAKIYLLTGDEYYKNVAENFWRYVAETQTYANGGTSNYEFFTGIDEEPLSDKTCETCCVYNMLKLTEYLFRWNQSRDYMDYYENVLYNQILGSQSSEGLKTYSVSLAIGGATEFLSHDGFECCLGTGMENPGRYDRMIYYEDEYGQLYVNLFVNSTLNWESKKIKLTQLTDYPNADTVKLTVDQAGASDASVCIRVPSWTENMEILLNGKKIPATVHNGYITITRKWETGDVVEVKVPMSLNLHVARGNEHLVAFKYGPVLLASDITGDFVRTVVAETRNPEDFIEKTGDNLRFRFQSCLKPGDVSMELKPFYEFERENRMVYWNMYTTEEYQTMGGINGTLADRVLEATVDYVNPGHMQSELDHNYQYQGDAQNGIYDPAAQAPATGSWRDVKGGWVSYDLKIRPDETNYLLSMFWGSDDLANANRVFDIMVEDEVLQEGYVLNRNEPDKIEYFYLEIPKELTEGKDTVTVKYRADAGNTAGGMFGVRTMSEPVGEIEWLPEQIPAEEEYTFTGYDYIRVSAKGKADVYLNDEKVGMINTKDSQEYAIVWESQNLYKNREYTLKLVSDGDFSVEYVQYGNENIKLGNAQVDEDGETDPDPDTPTPPTDPDPDTPTPPTDPDPDTPTPPTDPDPDTPTPPTDPDPDTPTLVTDIFDDVNEDDWFVPYVQYVYDEKIMTGIKGNLFGPGENLARAQFAIIIHRMNDTPNVEYTNRFIDVEAEQWYTDAILWAAGAGIVKGYEDGTHRFGTGDNITRAQMAVMMYRYADYRKFDVSARTDYDGFEDADDVEQFAADAMSWAVAEGIISGKDDNKNGTQELDPQGNASRAECAAIIQRFLDVYGK